MSPLTYTSYTIHDVYQCYRVATCKGDTMVATLPACSVYTYNYNYNYSAIATPVGFSYS